MKKMSVYSNNKRKWILRDVRLTENFIERFLGLMWKTDIGAEALAIAPCNSIHMFFMRMAIDAVFVDGDGRIIAVKKNMKPCPASRIYKGCRSVVEMPSGGADRIGLFCGEILTFSEYGET